MCQICGYSAPLSRIERIIAVKGDGASLRSTSGRNMGFMPGPRLMSSSCMGRFYRGRRVGWDSGKGLHHDVRGTHDVEV